MTQQWSDIRRTLSDEREASIKTRVAEVRATLPLVEIRKARLMPQNVLAERMQIDQGAISKLERRSDMYRSTLRSYVEAMGRQLEIRVIFPNGEILPESLGGPKPEVPESALV